MACLALQDTMQGLTEGYLNVKKLLTIEVMLSDREEVQKSQRIMCCYEVCIFSRSLCTFVAIRSRTILNC